MRYVVGTVCKLVIFSMPMCRCTCECCLSCNLQVNLKNRMPDLVESWSFHRNISLEDRKDVNGGCQWVVMCRLYGDEGDAREKVKAYLAVSTTQKSQQLRVAPAVADCNCRSSAGLGGDS